MKRSIACFLLMALIFFSVFSEASELSHGREYKVVKVIDGDTVQLGDGVRVRYLHVDTPETRKKIAGKWIYAPEPFAEAASKFNRTKVLGKKVSLDFDKNNKDKYGRVLAFVYRNKQMINLELVRRGLATVLILPPNTKYDSDFFAAEIEAKDKGKGVWKNLEEINPVEAAENVGKYCTVTGKISSVNSFRNTLELEIRTGKTGKSFRVFIYNNNLPYFKETGITPDVSMKGKAIEVTGKIQLKNGPTIVLFNPFMAKIL